MDDKTYKGLAISSGGYKGYGILGALDALEKSGRLSFGKDGFTRKFAGCSVGSVITTLLACGWHPGELFDEAIEIKIFKGFEDIDIMSFKNKYGIMSNKSLKADMDRLILMKRDAIPTLADLWDEGIYLSYAITDRSTKQGHKLDYVSNPLLPVNDGAMMSSNIPVVFPPIEFEGMQVIDGALINPFPLEYIDDGKDDILGVCVYGDTGDDMQSMISFVGGLIMVQIEEMQRMIIRNSTDRCDVLEMYCGDLNVLNTGDVHSEKRQMYREGQSDGRRLEKALVANKPKRKKRVPLKIRKFDKAVITTCLISQPLDILCEAYKQDPDCIAEVFQNLSSNRRERLLNFFRSFEVEKKEEPVISDSDDARELFNRMDPMMKTIISGYMSRLPSSTVDRTISGINSILGGIRMIGVTSLGYKSIDDGRVEVMDDDDSE